MFKHGLKICPWGSKKNPCSPCVSSRSRSQLIVKYQIIKYWTLCCVRSVSPTLIKIFSLILAQMFTSTRGCAEPMLLFCWLEVKVTLEGQNLSQKLFSNYCVNSINPIPIKGISSNLSDMFTSTRGCAEPMWPMCKFKVRVTIEGQISNN